MEDCVFCRKFREGTEIIYEGNHFFAQFDRFPISPGHAELVPIRHFAQAEEMNSLEKKEFWGSLFDVMKTIRNTNLEKLYLNMAANPIDDISKGMCEEMLSKPYIKSKFLDYNGAWNDGRAAGRTIDHLHFHIIPRYEGDVKDPTGGCRNIIPGMGNYKNWKSPPK